MVIGQLLLNFSFLLYSKVADAAAPVA